MKTNGSLPLAGAVCLCALLLQACAPWDDPERPSDPTNGLAVNEIPPPPLPLKGGVIHPLLFQMAESWPSDTRAPVALEFNLDAVEADANQFDYAAIVKEGDWFVFKLKDGGSVRYKPLKREGRLHTVVYQSDGGGSLSFTYEIKFVVDKNSLSIDGEARDVKTLKIVSFALLPRGS
jgi:hypothetical protein